MNQNELNKIIDSLKEVNTNELNNAWNLDLFKNKRIITFGTFDLLHIGHEKIINHCIQITGKEENVVIAVSSDDWNSLKGKKAYETQEIRVKNIAEKFPKAKIIIEDHLKPEQSWPWIWDKYKLDLIIMGGDHFESLSYINKTVTPNGNKMKIAFFERTPKISSTMIRNFKNN